MKVGVIGLGPMGAAMAEHLLKGGHELTVWNRTAAKAEPLVARGARLASSAAAAAAGAGVVLSSLAHDEAVEEVVLGPGGVVEGLAAGAVHVSTSTVSPALSARLAQAHADKGQGYVAAPVLGRPPAAAQGKLFVMAAGRPDTLEAARPVLEGLGQRLFVVGERPEQANVLKLCCNFLIFSTIEQLGEVFALTEKGGLERAKVFEVLTESFFTAPVHKNYGKLIVERAWEPGVPVKLAAKDTRLMLQTGEALGVPLPFASVVRDRFVAAQAQGEGDLDFAVLARHAARDAGLEE
jgi:3-hydroxyisobutyrate dehydrogenase-like beta-hydroxyacid dehydrogenase